MLIDFDSSSSSSGSGGGGGSGVGGRGCDSGGVVVVDWGFTTLLTSQVIIVAFYSEREKTEKFCSEALISA